MAENALRNSEIVVKAEKLSFKYQDLVEGIYDVDFDIKKGKLYFLQEIVEVENQHFLNVLMDLSQL